MFVDASFLIALIWREDDHHRRAVLTFTELTESLLVTISGVLDELVAHSVKRNREYRLDALATARRVLAPGSQWTVVFPTSPLGCAESTIASAASKTGSAWSIRSR